MISAVPWRSASGETSQPHRPTAASQPGDAAAAAPPPAPRRRPRRAPRRTASGPSGTPSAAPRHDAARPALRRRRGGRRAGPGRAAAAASPGRAASCAACGRPDARAGSPGSTSPPASSSSALGRGQLGAQLVRQRAPLGIELERVVDRVAELERQVAAAVAKRGQRLAEPPGGRRRPAGAHRVRARPGLVEREGERVDVAGRAEAGALGLLGRHVGERPDHVAGVGERVVAHDVRHAEVGQLREARPGRGLGDHHHVLRLDVAVDDPVRVGVLERVAERHADLGHVAVRHRAARISSARVRPRTSSETR